MLGLGLFLARSHPGLVCFVTCPKLPIGLFLIRVYLSKKRKGRKEASAFLRERGLHILGIVGKTLF